MEASLAIIVIEGGIALVCPMAPAAIHDHHDVCAGLAADRPHWRERWAELLGIKVRHDWRENVRGALLDRPQDPEQHTTRAPAPRALASPGLAFEGFVAVALALAQGAGGESAGRGATSPTWAEQSARGSLRLHRAS
jgi:hypothetical protein